MTDTSPTSSARVDREPRGSRLLALQILRLPAAITLLALVRPPRYGVATAMGLYTGPGPSYTAMWIRMVLVAVAFLLIVTVGRQGGAPVPLRTVEAAIAAVLGLTPPFLWGAWLDHHPISRAISFEFVAPLAIVWFAVCVAAVVRQSRAQRSAETRSTTAGLTAVSLTARGRAWLPWLRLPVLVAMLLLVASFREELASARAGVGTFEVVWAPLTLTALAFVAIALISRHRVPWPLLVAELVLAGVLGFTPRFQWLEVSDWPALASALSFEFTAPLAIGWFTVALVAALERWPWSHRAPAG